MTGGAAQGRPEEVASAASAAGIEAGAASLALAWSEPANQKPTDVDPASDAVARTSSDAATKLPTRDCVEQVASAVPLMSCEGAESAADDCSETAAELTPLAVVEASGGVSAEELMAIFEALKSTTQWRGRQWVEAGCPIAIRLDEHHRITESLSPFRAAAGKAGEAERQRFFMLSAPSGGSATSQQSPARPLFTGDPRRGVGTCFPNLLRDEVLQSGATHP